MRFFIDEKERDSFQKKTIDSAFLFENDLLFKNNWFIGWTVSECEKKCGHSWTKYLK